MMARRFTQSGGTNNSTSLGTVNGGNGTYNLNGGLLILSSLNQGSGLAVFNFNGGTLPRQHWISIFLPMTLGGSGATFDTAGNTVTLSGALSGNGSLTKVDSGSWSWAAPIPSREIRWSTAARSPWAIRRPCRIARWTLAATG